MMVTDRWAHRQAVATTHGIPSRAMPRHMHATSGMRNACGIARSTVDAGVPASPRGADTPDGNVARVPFGLAARVRRADADLVRVSVTCVRLAVAVAAHMTTGARRTPQRPVAHLTTCSATRPVASASASGSGVWLVSLRHRRAQKAAARRWLLAGEWYGGRQVRDSHLRILPVTAACQRAWLLHALARTYYIYGVHRKGTLQYVQPRCATLGLFVSESCCYSRSTTRYTTF
jgi:hypothetical protein